MISVFSKKIYLLVLLGALLSIQTFAQSYAFGLKGGPAIGFQRWGEGSRNVLWAHHIAAFIESAPEEGGGVMYAQAGYHVRGSAIRFQSFSIGNNQFLGQNTDEFRFNNASLTIGFKNRMFKGSTVLYYMFGVRSDYTLSTNLDEYSDLVLFNPYYPLEQFVRKFNYGVSIGGGWEFPFSEFISGIVELSFHPDFSRQYDSPSIPNVVNPFNQGGTNITIPDRRIVNYTAEISIGLRFLRKIIYID